jgi:LPS O-antigen subunit length determinant protein (WzzB/FepE family)
LLIVISDWCENLSLAAVIHAFPDQLDVISTAASFFTSIKWIFLILVVMTLVTVGALAVTKQFWDSSARR